MHPLMIVARVHISPPLFTTCSSELQLSVSSLPLGSGPPTLASAQRCAPKCSCIAHVTIPSILLCIRHHLASVRTLFFQLSLCIRSALPLNATIPSTSIGLTYRLNDSHYSALTAKIVIQRWRCKYIYSLARQIVGAMLRLHPHSTRAQGAACGNEAGSHSHWMRINTALIPLE